MPVIDVHPHDEHIAAFAYMVPVPPAPALGAPESAALVEA